MFDLYVNQLGDQVIDLWQQGDMPAMTVPHKWGGERTVDCLDLLATTFSDKPGMAIAAVNKDAEHTHTITISMDRPAHVTLLTLNGDSKDAYNDVGDGGVYVTERSFGPCSGSLAVELPAHSVNVIHLA